MIDYKQDQKYGRNPRFNRKYRTLELYFKQNPSDKSLSLSTRQYINPGISINRTLDGYIR